MKQAASSGYYHCVKLWLARLCVLHALCLAACMGGLDDPELAEVEQGAARCPNWMCGSGMNSPEIDHVGIHDVPTKAGLVTANGFRLHAVERLGKPQSLRVIGSDVETTDRATGIVRVGATALPVDIVLVNDRSGATYTLRIDARSTATFWARPNGKSLVTPTYFVTWKKGLPQASGEVRNICTQPILDQVGGMDGSHVVLFEGDRIDARAKTVAAPDPVWFNLGCAGHALMKLHMVGHTQGALVRSAGLLATTRAQRQTFLKMITADYCGTGDSFTVAGQPLEYTDPLRWLPLPAAGSLEARWTERGAACLNTPRIDANPTAEGSAVFGTTVKAEIAATCSIPKCTGAAGDPFAGWVSVNP